MASIFWKWLGYRYASIDIDGTPDCIPIDLNYDKAPSEHVGQYDLVTNFGTSEHIANQLNVFSVIHELTALGGVMYHNVPAQGLMTHGLINYTHKFFWYLSRSNGYKVIDLHYYQRGDYYPLPDNILDTTYDHNPDPNLPSYRERDGKLHVSLQKIYDTPFVPPVDVPTGSETRNPALREKYWSVFRPNAFDSIPPLVPNDRKFRPEPLKGTAE
jgi:hypothetical protein